MSGPSRYEGRGRPLKLDVETRKALCGYFAVGATIEEACRAVGVSARAFHYWQAIAEQHRKMIYPDEYSADELETVKGTGKELVPTHSPYVELMEDVERARAIFSLNLKLSWSQHAKGDWRAAEAFLRFRSGLPGEGQTAEKVELDDAEVLARGLEILDRARARRGLPAVTPDPDTLAETISAS